jgi:hypothetical protein
LGLKGVFEEFFPQLFFVIFDASLVPHPLFLIVQFLDDLRHQGLTYAEVSNFYHAHSRDYVQMKVTRPRNLLNLVFYQIIAILRPISSH